MPGNDPDWIRKVHGFALKPDRILYLRAGVDDVVTRVLQEGGLDYWESGMDLHLRDDMYQTFVEYQNRIMAQFEKMVEDHGSSMPPSPLRPSSLTLRVRYWTF